MRRIIIVSGALLALVPASCRDLSGPARVPTPAPMGFVLPLVGTLNHDFYLVNYVDLRPGTGVLDFACGLKSYDGHTGVDLTLPSFRSMDEGVDIVAAAPGRVTYVRDGLFDRNTAWGPGGLGNHVVIQHRDGFESLYGHMANGSVAVQPGQMVQAGTRLGRVGSSGTSDMPHLHVEFRWQGVPFEAHAGACATGTDHWADALPYQDDFAVIALGTTRQTITPELVRDPPEEAVVFSTAEPQLSAWVHLFNVRAGTALEFRIHDPQGELVWSQARTQPEFRSMGWWWVWHAVAGEFTEPGTWRVDFLHDGEVAASRIFQLETPAAGAVQVPATAPAAPRGSGVSWVGGRPNE
jgi:murein DD-endopeptidase MepM/ murein hydrolase activator NlpD